MAIVATRGKTAETAEQVSALVGLSRVLVGLVVQSLSELDDHWTLTQFRALVTLSEAGTLTATELAEQLGISAPTVTRLADRLLGEGVLDRVVNPDDRRQVLLTLTAAGDAIVERVMDRRRRDLEDILGALEPADRAALARTVETLTARAVELHGQGIALGHHDQAI